MFKGKEIVEIGRFVDDEIVQIEPDQKINNNSELVYEKGKGKITIPFASEDELEKLIGLLDKLK